MFSDVQPASGYKRGMPINHREMVVEQAGRESNKEGGRSFNCERQVAGILLTTVKSSCSNTERQAWGKLYILNQQIYIVLPSKCGMAFRISWY